MKEYFAGWTFYNWAALIFYALLEIIAFGVLALILVALA